MWLIESNVTKKTWRILDFRIDQKLKQISVKVLVKLKTARPGRQYSLIGSRDSTQSLGLVPTAVTWLNKLGDDDRSKCGPNTVHVTSLRLG